MVNGTRTVYKCNINVQFQNFENPNSKSSQVLVRLKTSLNKNDAKCVVTFGPPLICV